MKARSTLCDVSFVCLCLEHNEDDAGAERVKTTLVFSVIPTLIKLPCKILRRISHVFYTDLLEL